MLAQSRVSVRGCQLVGPVALRPVERQGVVGGAEKQPGSKKETRSGRGSNSPFKGSPGDRPPCRWAPLLKVSLPPNGW